MKRLLALLWPMAALAAFVAVWGLCVAGAAAAADHTLVAKTCLKCHGEFGKMKDVVAGEFNSLSNKAKSISVSVTPEDTQIIKFTDKTTVTNVPEIKALKKPIPVLVRYEKQGADLVAVSIKAKPQIKVPENQQVSVEEMARLTALGPEKGKYTLIDSRPGAAYQEGHLPGAVSVPFPKMPEMMAKLPQDKDSLVIFYCGGFR